MQDVFFSPVIQRGLTWICKVEWGNCTSLFLDGFFNSVWGYIMWIIVPHMCNKLGKFVFFSCFFLSAFLNSNIWKVFCLLKKVQNIVSLWSPQFNTWWELCNWWTDTYSDLAVQVWTSGDFCSFELDQTAPQKAPVCSCHPALYLQYSTWWWFQIF